MSTPNRTARKSAAITDTGNNRIAKPTLGRSIGNKGKGPVYEVPKPVRPKTVKK